MVVLTLQFSSLSDLATFFQSVANSAAFTTQLNGISTKLDTLTTLTNQEITKMAALDDEITQLQAQVASEETVEDSAVALINGFSAQLAAAVAAASAQGASPAQLAALTALGTSISTKSAALAAAVAANTAPPAPPTPPAPPAAS